MVLRITRAIVVSLILFIEISQRTQTIYVKVQLTTEIVVLKSN